jgi:hypothetical protein
MTNNHWLAGAVRATTFVVFVTLFEVLALYTG